MHPPGAPSISTISSDTTDSDFSGPILNFEDFSVSLPSPALRTDLLSFPQEDIYAALNRAVIFRDECAEVGRHVERLWQLLRSVNEMAVYDRPFVVIATEVSRCLEKSLTLVKKCRRNLLTRVFTVTILSTHNFRKLVNLLDCTVADMVWLLSIYRGGGVVLTLPPIACNDPVISWIWSFISTLYVGQLQDKIEAATELASLARDNDRYKRMIVVEGGISPLVKLLKDGSSTEGQIIAASALSTLANDVESVGAIINEIGIPFIVKVFRGSQMKVQIRVVNLVAKMAEHSPQALEEFARLLIKSLLTLLSFELLMDDDSKLEMEKNNVGIMDHPGGSSKMEVKNMLKISCAEALWRLAKGSVANSRRIIESEGLLCLVQAVETEKGELQHKCLMTIMELTAATISEGKLVYPLPRRLWISCLG